MKDYDAAVGAVRAPLSEQPRLEDLIRFATLGANGHNTQPWRFHVGAGKMAPPYSSVYAATKGAVDSITVALSKELGARKIRVDSVNPGLVETEGTTSDDPSTQAFDDFLLKTTPLGRIGRPDDIANVAVFLASDAAHWVDGQQIIVAGGQTM